MGGVTIWFLVAAIGGLYTGCVILGLILLGRLSGNWTESIMMAVMFLGLTGLTTLAVMLEFWRRGM